MSELPSRSPFRKATWPCVVRSSEWVITVAYYSLCIHILWYVSLIFRHHIHVSEWNKEHNATSPTPPPHPLFPLPLLPSQYLIAFYATNIPCKLLPYHKTKNKYNMWQVSWTPTWEARDQARTKKIVSSAIFIILFRVSAFQNYHNFFLTITLPLASSIIRAS